MASDKAARRPADRPQRRTEATESRRAAGSLWRWSLLLVAGGLWPGSAAARREVRVAAAARGLRRRAAGAVLNASGYVTARRQATVSSKVTGKVIEVLVEEGMVVEEGQVLARLDDSTARRELARAEARLGAQRGASTRPRSACARRSSTCGGCAACSRRG